MKGVCGYEEADLKLREKSLQLRGSSLVLGGRRLGLIKILKEEGKNSNLEN